MSMSHDPNAAQNSYGSMNQLYAQNAFQQSQQYNSLAQQQAQAHQANLIWNALNGRVTEPINNKQANIH